MNLSLLSLLVEAAEAPADFMKGAWLTSRVMARNKEPVYLGEAQMGSGGQIFAHGLGLEQVEAEKGRVKPDTKGHLFKIGKYFYFFAKPDRGFMMLPITGKATQTPSSVIRDKTDRRISLAVLAGEAGIGPVFGVHVKKAQVNTPLPIHLIQKDSVRLLTMDKLVGYGRPKPSHADIAILDGDRVVAGHQAVRDAVAAKRGVLAVDLQDLPSTVSEAVNEVPDASDAPGYKKTLRDPKFKQWFAGSKIVDRSGRPLLVAHMTDKDFKTFRGGGDRGGAIFFTPGPDPYYGSKMITAYLKVTNPWNWHSTKDRRWAKATVRALPGFEQYMMDQIDEGDWEPFELPGMRAKLKEAGYDGYIIPADSRTVVVYDPKQIWVVSKHSRFDDSFLPPRNRGKAPSVYSKRGDEHRPGYEGSPEHLLRLTNLMRMARSNADMFRRMPGRDNDAAEHETEYKELRALILGYRLAQRKRAPVTEAVDDGGDDEMVGAVGKPLTVVAWHGTPYGKFDRFDLDMLGAVGDTARLAPAIYFTSSKTNAAGYARSDVSLPSPEAMREIKKLRMQIDERREQLRVAGENFRQDPQIKAWVALRRELEENSSHERDPWVYEVELTMKKPFVVDANDHKDMEARSLRLVAVTQAKRADCDGAVIKNMVDSHTGLGAKATTYAVFSPGQADIKKSRKV